MPSSSVTRVFMGLVSALKSVLSPTRFLLGRDFQFGERFDPYAQPDDSAMLLRSPASVSEEFWPLYAIKLASPCYLPLKTIGGGNLSSA
jgi:hypothetical protein